MRTLTWTVAVGLLTAALTLSIATLTTHPPLYGDEGLLGSAAWSTVSGHGFRGSIAVGGSVFDGTFDYWFPRLGTAPFLAAELLGPTDFAVYRGAAFVVAMGALLIFALTIARLYAWPVALAAAAALVVSWAFFGASHYARWDSLAFLVVVVLLAILVRGPPGPRTSIVLGLILGVALDVQLSVLAAVPGVALLLGWERQGRGRRLSLFAGGLSLGVALYLLMHTLPSPATSVEQYEVFYGDTYKPPLLAVLQELSLSPIGDELDRYERMTTETLKAMGAILGLAVLAGLALLVAAVRGRLGPGYPQQAVAAVLLLSHVCGIALIQANKTPMYLGYAMPYALATLVAAILWLANRVGLTREARVAAVVAFLAMLTVGAGKAMLDEARSTPDELADDPRIAQKARTLAGPHGTVMGEWLYWWAFRDDRFRFNSLITMIENDENVSFEAAFRRLCPDVVMLDDVWLNRFDPAVVRVQEFRTLEPTDAADLGRFRGVLREDYRLVEELSIGTHAIELWQRTESGCQGVLTTAH
jgi:hypothetical protein